MNDNDRNDTYIIYTLQNGDLISGIGLLNSNTLPQDNESSNLNDINISDDNDDVNDNYCYISSYTVF